jgi:hypothetical protein
MTASNATAADEPQRHGRVRAPTALTASAGQPPALLEAD